MIQIDNVLRIARRESDSFDEELRQFLIKDFPSSGPKNFIEVLRSINGKIIKDVEARVECTVNGLLNDNDAETFASLPLRLFPLLHHLLEHIDKAEEQENPYGILSLFTRLIGHFESDFEVVLKSQWQFSYDMCELAGKLKLISENFFNERYEPAEPFQSPLNSPPSQGGDGGVIGNTIPCPPSQGGDKRGVKVSRQFHRWFIVLSYPASHRNSAFMHAVQGHEVGQVFNRVNGISSKVIELIDPARVQEFKGSIVQGSLEICNPVTLEPQCEAMGRLLRILDNWIETMVSDIFAIVVFGPSYLFALTEFLTTQGSIGKCSSKRPSGAFRIGNLLKILEDLGFIKNLGDAVKVRINEIKTNVRALQKKQKTPVQESLERCLSMEGDGIVARIFSMVREKTKGFAYEPQKLLDEVPELVKLMENLIPPIELFDIKGRSSRPANIISIMNAGWIVYLTKLADVYKNFSVETEDEQAQLFDILNRLLLKAMEVNEICERLSKNHERPSLALEILKYMYTEESDLQNRLFITPLLKPAQQLGNLSVDLRLGNEFIVPMKTEYPVLDPNRYGNYKVAEIEEYQKKIYKRYGEPFILHPGQFVLGCTLEFIRLPNYFSAYIIGRSSWGRLGLTIATAIAIDPGYSGVLTLELLNSGETPIVLYPGARIAQIILHKQTPSSIEYSRRKLSKYKFPVSVEFSKIRGDADWDDLREMTK